MFMKYFSEFFEKAKKFQRFNYIYRIISLIMNTHCECGICGHFSENECIKNECKCCSNFHLRSGIKSNEK